MYFILRYKCLLIMLLWVASAVSVKVYDPATISSFMKTFAISHFRDVFANPRSRINNYSGFIYKINKLLQSLNYSFDEKLLMDRPIIGNTYEETKDKLNLVISKLEKMVEEKKIPSKAIRADVSTVDERVDAILRLALNDISSEVKSSPPEPSGHLTSTSLYHKRKSTLADTENMSLFKKLAADARDILMGPLLKTFTGGFTKVEEFKIYTKAETVDFIVQLERFFQNGQNKPAWIDRHFDWNLSRLRPNSTLLAVPFPHIVPGSRFMEFYYWDSHFVMRGLAALGEIRVMEHMVNNYMYLIDTYGFIPNGARTYYLDRSQPPLFSQSVELLYFSYLIVNDRESADNLMIQALPRMIKEYWGFWMNPSTAHVVDAENGNSTHPLVDICDTLTLFTKISTTSNVYANRYHSYVEYPRLESYSRDMEVYEYISKTKGIDAARYAMRAIRAAAESGWDFTSRWNRVFMESKSGLGINSDQTKPSDGRFEEFFSDLDTLNVVPTDLNAYLLAAEKSIINLLSAFKTRETLSDLLLLTQFKVIHDKRVKSFESLFQKKSSQGTAYMDYDFKNKKFSNVESAAGLATQSIVEKNHDYKSSLMTNLGIKTTNAETGQQWDSPNMWAPLQGFILAEDMEASINAQNTVFENAIPFVRAIMQSSKDSIFYEKYSSQGSAGGGGEYAVQVGFGWTNAKLLEVFTFASETALLNQI